MEKIQQQQMKKTNQKIIIDNIIQEFDKKRDIAINKKQKAVLKDESLEYGEEEDAIDIYFHNP